LTYNKVIPDVIGNLVEERYTHAGIFVIERGGLGVPGGFAEEGECETAPLVRRLVQSVVSMALCRLLSRLAAGVMGWMLTLIFILKVDARLILAG
jgi:hypothetical protein